MSHYSQLPASQSANSVVVPTRRMPPSSSAVSLNFPQSATVHNLSNHGTQMRSSRTWTTSSGDFGLLSDTDKVDERGVFVEEYNRLAKKNGVRILVVEDFERQRSNGLHPAEKRGWFYRILRSSSNNPPPSPPPPKAPARLQPRHKRSVSDLAHNLVARREPLQDVDIQTMVRLSGKSVFYLPSEYAPSALVLPTCLRATAQYLAQNITTRGIFRIPGSVRIVNALFDYYCYMENGDSNIASTVRCANLPVHIRSSVHDIASTFKRLLSVLPGGILGSLSIFDALVAIHSQLHGDPEFPRTKHTKVRARLIALAVGSIQSQFRRELICAVFGLLSLIGRVAEVTPREDESGRPLPTGDLMGYSALGIVFGPLLVGDLLAQYPMRVATPTSGLLLFPLTPQRLRRERRKSKGVETKTPGETTVNKVLVANDITEMLIANWRDVVRQMKALGIHHRKDASSVMTRADSIQPSISQDFVIRKPRSWDKADLRMSANATDRDASPEPQTPTLGIKRQRPRSRKSASSNRVMSRPSIGALSPTAEESAVEEEPFQDNGASSHGQRLYLYNHSHELNATESNKPTTAQSKMQNYGDEWNEAENTTKVKAVDERRKQSSHERSEHAVLRSPQVSLDDVPPRTSSKQRQCEFGPPPRHAFSFSSGDDFIHRPSIKERPSLESVRGRRSKQRSKASMQEDTMRNRSVHSVNRAPNSSRSSSARRNHPSQASHLSFPSARRAVEEKISVVPQHTPFIGSDTEEELSEELSSLLDELELDPRLENDRTVTGSSSARSPSIRGEITQSRHQGEDYFYTGRIKGMQGESDAEAQPPPRTSFDVTPRQFYSPMRVPPSLSGLDKEGYPDIIPNGDTGQVSSEDISRVTKGSFSEFTDNSTREEDQAKSQSKASGLSPHRVRQFGVPFSGTLPRIRTSQTQVHNATRSSSGERSFVRPSVSEAASKRGAVKAMAARFEGQDPNDASPSRPKIERADQSILSPHVSSQTGRSMKESKSGPLWTSDSDRKTSWSGSSQHAPRKSASRPNTFDDAVIRKLRESVSDNIALRAASIIETEKEKSSSPIRPPLITLRPPAQAKKSQPELTDEKKLKDQPSIGSLGTMVSPQEQPPIAQHLNLARPPSSSSFIAPSHEDLSTLSEMSSTATPRPGSTSSLHSQIRNLQRHLDARTEEAAQLRRQLEAQEDSDIGTLSEQLREAKREVMVWRDRAEAAERRVKVFERFTARLRGIREAAATVDSSLVPQDETSEDEEEPGEYEDDEISPNQHVRFVEGRRAVARTTEPGEHSDDSGTTEDAGVITARIRRCLHGGPGKHDGAADTLPRHGLGGDGAASPRAKARDISQSSAVEIWMAAQEFMQLDSEAATRDGE